VSTVHHLAYTRRRRLVDQVGPLLRLADRYREHRRVAHAVDQRWLAAGATRNGRLSGYRGGKDHLVSDGRSTRHRVRQRCLDGGAIGFTRGHHRGEPASPPSPREGLTPSYGPRFTPEIYANDAQRTEQAMQRGGVARSCGGRAHRRRLVAPLQDLSRSSDCPHEAQGRRTMRKSVSFHQSDESRPISVPPIQGLLHDIRSSAIDEFGDAFANHPINRNRQETVSDESRGPGSPDYCTIV